MRGLGHQQPLRQCTRLFQLLPAVTASMHFCRGVSAPGVPRSFPISLVNLRSEPACWCCWLTSTGCGQSNPTFCYGATGSWSAALHRSSLLIFSGHRIQRTAVDKSMELMECWLRHSPCFWSTEEFWLQICVKILNLMDFPISLELLTFLRIRKAFPALPILALASASVAPCVTFMIPKWVKELTSARGCPASVTGLLLECCILMIFFLTLLMWRPLLDDAESKHVILSGICAWLWEKSVRSSASEGHQAVTTVSTVCHSFFFSFCRSSYEPVDLKWVQ